MSDCDLKSTIEKVTSLLGYSNIKHEQQRSIMEFVKGHDVFISLPTGMELVKEGHVGMMFSFLCQQVLGNLCVILFCHYVFDELRMVVKKSMILVVSPLLALMKDQVASIEAKEFLLSM